MPQVTYDSRAVRIDNKRTLLLTGGMHYPRSTPTMWPDLMRRTREAGLNTIDTYVFWNLHERSRGVYDFSGRLDLVHFCRIAQEHGLNVVLRIGPYICAETDYGGFPAWLRDVPGIRMRTVNQPFMAEMERWVRLVCEIVKPMLAPQGGPIILAQLENEYKNVAKNYGDEAPLYLEWVGKLAAELNVGVPWVMCMGAAPGMIETLNENRPHKLVKDHFTVHPDQPAICTELYPGWYDIWGGMRCTRSPQSTAFASARFVAAGGTGVTYYMWHGGTNFGRETMYLQTTGYDFTAPLNEYGMATTSARHLARLHRILAEHNDQLLASAPPPAQELGKDQWAWTYGSGPRALTFVANDGDAAKVNYGGRTYQMARESVLLLEGDRLLMDTSEIHNSDVVRLSVSPLRHGLEAPTYWSDALPVRWPEALAKPHVTDVPQEQLKLTANETDYCWYTAQLHVTAEQAGEGKLTLHRVADMVHIYIDGRPVADTQPPLNEDRGRVDSDAFRQEFSLKLKRGRHELAILCCGLGMVKGDWQLWGQNMVEERKGLWGPVLWNAQEIPGPWSMYAGVLGERLGVFGKAQHALPWQKWRHGSVAGPLTWYRYTFARPKNAPTLALDLQGMGKGMIYLNGQCAGRYWQALATGSRGSWLAEWEDPRSGGKLVQRYYHLPQDWLTEQNTLILFEEQGGDPGSVRLVHPHLVAGAKA